MFLLYQPREKENKKRRKKKWLPNQQTDRWASACLLQHLAVMHYKKLIQETINVYYMPPRYRWCLSWHVKQCYPILAATKIWRICLKSCISRPHSSSPIYHLGLDEDQQCRLPALKYEMISSCLIRVLWALN
jgi:hypothetical protein